MAKGDRKQIYNLSQSFLNDTLYAVNEHEAIINPKWIDLNDYVSKYPAATFFARVTGECMTGSGIYPNDLLVVDKSLSPQQRDKEYLMPDNSYNYGLHRGED